MHTHMPATLSDWRKTLTCVQDKSCHDPRKRMKRFFETLYRSLAKGGRAVLQIYPESTDQV